MGNAQIKKVAFASVVSEIQQSDIYLTIKGRLFEAPKANLNGVRVTPAFLDEIVINSDNYVGLPLYADVSNLANGNYNRLGHMYDPDTGEFRSTQIGSFYKFEKENLNNGSCLIGYARVPKRNKNVCRAVSTLFAEGKLKFSFEISCGSYTELEDGTISIDVGGGNVFEGEAIVSFPACEDAVALELVAECNAINNDGKEELDMHVKDIVAEEVENIETVAVENIETVAEAENAEAETVEETETAEVTETEVASEEDAACKKKKCSEEEEEDSEKKTASEQDTAEIAESESEEEKEKYEEEESDEEESEKEKKEQCAETRIVEANEIKEYTLVTKESVEIEKLIASVSSLTELVASMKEELASLKVVKPVEESNPFMAEINLTPKKYSLLDPVETTNNRTLLD